MRINNLFHHCLHHMVSCSGRHSNCFSQPSFDTLKPAFSIAFEPEHVPRLARLQIIYTTDRKETVAQV
jgi:hypothetical protein